MISGYIFGKMASAKYKILEDGAYFGEIPKLKGVWASAESLESCRAELQEVLEDWIMLKLGSGEKISGLNKSKKELEYA